MPAAPCRRGRHAFHRSPGGKESLLFLPLFLLGLAFRQPFDTALAVHAPEGLVRWINLSFTFTLLVICIFVAVDLIKALVRIGRKQLAK